RRTPAGRSASRRARCCASDCAVMPASSPLPSGCFEQPVLADRLARELAHDAALLHHYDAVGERQHRLGLGRHHDHRQPLLLRPPASPWSRSPRTMPTTSSLAPTSMPRVGSLSTSTLGGQVSHLASATFCRLPPDRLCSSASTVGGRIDSASAWRRAMSRSAE